MYQQSMYQGCTFTFIAWLTTRDFGISGESYSYRFSHGWAMMAPCAALLWRALPQLLAPPGGSRGGPDCDGLAVGSEGRVPLPAPDTAGRGPRFYFSAFMMPCVCGHECIGHRSRLYRRSSSCVELPSPLARCISCARAFSAAPGTSVSKNLSIPTATSLSFAVWKMWSKSAAKRREIHFLTYLANSHSWEMRNLLRTLFDFI